MDSAWTSIIVFVLSVFVLIFFVGQAFFAGGEKVTTETAFTYSMTEDIPFEGVFLRDETVIHNSGTGVVDYEHSDGSKVGKSSVIARRYRSEADIERRSEIEKINEQIAVLTDAQRLAGTDNNQLETISSQINERHSLILESLIDGDYSSAHAQENAMLGVLSKREISRGDIASYESKISSLRSRASQLEAMLSGDVQDITILYTNDVHTYIDNKSPKPTYAAIAALKKSIEDTGRDVLLVDAGDHIQGTAYGSMDEGATIIQLMNAAGYDAATPGNHEFDYGMARAKAIIKEADFPYVSCNWVDLRTGFNVLPSVKFFFVGGRKIAFVGVTTPETFTKSTPAYFMNDAQTKYIYDILGGEDGQKLYDAVQKAIDKAEFWGADTIIGLGHLGVDPSSSPWTSEEVIAHYEKSDYVSKDFYEKDPDIKEAVDFITSKELLAIGQEENLTRLQKELLNKDWFMTLLDFKEYCEKKEEAYACYNDREKFAKMMLINIAKAGYFSSDRTIEEYERDIWKSR